MSVASWIFISILSQQNKVGHRPPPESVTNYDIHVFISCKEILYVRLYVTEKEIVYV